jgi:predicted extracellular nuclease
VLVRTGSPRVLARRAALGTVAASMAVVGLPTLAQAAPPTTPFISEIHYDNTGADTGEFVEVEFPAGTTSEGWKVFLYNGNGGVVYNAAVRQPLPSVTGPAVAVIEGFPASDGIQNGSPDGLALVRPDGTVAEFLSYEGVFAATAGPANGMTSTDIGVSEAGSEPAGESLSRRYDTETGALAWFTSAPSTKGTVNATFTPEPPPPPATPCSVATTHEIGGVQGNGATTPVNGQQVTVRGTVVGDLPAFSGFYLQDVDGDGDAGTSDGIFVFSPVAVDLGDTVAVTGRAQEFSGQTQISSQSDVEVCTDGTDANLPAAAALDLPADDATRERLEGMLVAPADTLTVSEVFDLTSFGELTLSEGGPLVQPTELARPRSPEAAAVAASNTIRRIVLDDGVSARVGTTARPYLSPETPVRVGDELAFTSPLVRASASASGACSRPTARLPAPSRRRTPGRLHRTRSAATSSSARSTS